MGNISYLHLKRVDNIRIKKILLFYVQVKFIQRKYMRKRENKIIKYVFHFLKALKILLKMPLKSIKLKKTLQRVVTMSF